MSDEQPNKDEKTEEATAKRLKDAREKGQVPRSKELNAMMSLLCSGVGIWILGSWISGALRKIMTEALTFDTHFIAVPDMMIQRFYHAIKLVAMGMIPFLMIMLLASFLGALFMGGILWSSKAFAPNWSRINPLNGLKRMFSMKGVFELGKSVLKFILVGTVSYLVIKGNIEDILSLSHQSLHAALYEGMMLLIRSFLAISGCLVVIALIDAPYQWYQHKQQLKMTKQEVKDEYKETEGKPEVKSRIRRMQQDIARRRMMSEVPKANVIITNPTHYAVAIRYEKNGKKAPVVVAKGKDNIAFHINSIAKSHHIPVISVPPLARAIYYSTKINREIPRGLYVAVAQVLAYIYQLRDIRYYDESPRVLQEVPIPEDLKRDSEESIDG